MKILTPEFLIWYSLIFTNLTVPLLKAEILTAVAAGVEAYHIVKSLVKFFNEDKKNLENSLRATRDYDIYQGIRNMNTDLQTMISDIPERTVLIQNMQTFEDKIEEIENYYKSMFYYNISHQNEVFEATQKSNIILDPSSDGPVRSMHACLKLLAFGQVNILDMLKKNSLKYLNSCSKEDSQRSLQSTFYDYLKIMQLLETKVYFILDTASYILNYHRPENSDITKLKYQDMIKNLENNHNNMLQKYELILPVASRNVWLCDPEPSNYEEDVTHVRLKNVFRGHIANERNLQNKFDNNCPKGSKCGSINPATESCGITIENMPSNTYLDDIVMIKRPLCNDHKRCNGSLWDCREAFGRWTTTLKVCLSDINSDRNYDFVETYDTSESHRYGLKTDCKTKPIKIVPETFLLFSPNCFSCYCICAEKTHISRSSLIISPESLVYNKNIEADAKDNYVITGARFRKTRGIIYIQIQQGKVLKNGYVDETTVHWKTEPDDLTNSQNHIRLHWQKRSIELQDIDVPTGHVLLGVTFTTKTKDGINRLRILTLSRPFNFYTGEIDFEEPESFVSGAEPSSIGMDTYNLKLPDATTKNSLTVTNQYLKFSISNFESDFGQTTVPFIDIRDVTSSKPFFMSGIGIYYRKSSDNDVAGFLGLKLKTYDVSQNLPKD